MELFVDHGYKTALGTSFYDRVWETSKLEHLAQRYRVVIIYGPRGAGKSELVRYWVKRRGINAIGIDARLLRAGRVLGEDTILLKGLAASVAEKLLQVIRESSGLMDLLVGVAESVFRVLEKPSIVFIDEFHELPLYGSRGPARYSEAVADLASIAALMAKHEVFEKIRLVVTVSEGFAASHETRKKLLGYSTTYMLVEHLDPMHFAALHKEYSSIRECTLPAETIYALYSGAPGMLVELCGIQEEDLLDHIIPDITEYVEEALGKARRRLGLEPREAIMLAHRVMTSAISPLRDTEAYEMAETLLEENIVYPKKVGEGLRYVPQYPVYGIVVGIAYEKRAESLLEIDPREVLQEALRKVKARRGWFSPQDKKE